MVTTNSAADFDDESMEQNLQSLDRFQYVDPDQNDLASHNTINNTFHSTEKVKGTSKYVDVANDNKNVQIVKNVNIPPKQLKNQYVSSLSKCQFNYKFILVGNSSVGKTSLTTRCVFNEFNENSANSRVCQVVSMPPYNIEGT